MRRFVWLLLFGAVCLGCGKTKELPPNAVLEPDKSSPPNIVVQPEDPHAGKVVGLEYVKLWYGKDQPVTPGVLKVGTTQQHFATHQKEYLVPTTVGTFATLASGGPHGIVTPVVFTNAYPEVAKQIEARWPNPLIEAVEGNAIMLDTPPTRSESGTTRRIVLRVKDGKDELRIRFGEYLVRLEEAMKADGATITAHQRGGLRDTGALSDIRYQIGNRTGFVRSVVIRGYEADGEVTRMMLAEEGNEGDTRLFRGILSPANGPYLVVFVKEQSEPRP
ncbi:MAG: hypothetical protein L0241_18205 [Planctomycetia bacterium]|nr:hypothetical protein [Planctomycetia bacterium]